MRKIEIWYAASAHATSVNIINQTSHGPNTVWYTQKKSAGQPMQKREKRNSIIIFFLVECSVRRWDFELMRKKEAETLCYCFATSKASIQIFHLTLADESANPTRCWSTNIFIFMNSCSGDLNLELCVKCFRFLLWATKCKGLQCNTCTCRASIKFMCRFLRGCWSTEAKTCVICTEIRFYPHLHRGYRLHIYRVAYYETYTSSS